MNRYFLAIQGANYGFGRSKDVALRALNRLSDIRPQGEETVYIFHSNKPLEFEARTRNPRGTEGGEVYVGTQRCPEFEEA